jgi:hypothetical protein
MSGIFSDDFTYDETLYHSKPTNGLYVQMSNRGDYYNNFDPNLIISSSQIYCIGGTDGVNQQMLDMNNQPVIDLQTAFDVLSNYYIQDDTTVTLKLVSGFVAVNVTQSHVQGGKIEIDLNGLSYQITTGDAFTVCKGRVLKIINSSKTLSIISTLDNNNGNGIHVYESASVYFKNMISTNIQIGNENCGFYAGINAHSHSFVYCPYIICRYNNIGISGLDYSTILAYYCVVSKNIEHGVFAGNYALINVDDALSIANNGNALYADDNSCISACDSDLSGIIDPEINYKAYSPSSDSTALITNQLKFDKQIIIDWRF